MTIIPLSNEKLAAEKLNFTSFAKAFSNLNENKNDRTEWVTSRAMELLSTMTINEKINQLLFVTPEALTGVSKVIQAGETTKRSLENYPVGGVILFDNNIESKEQLTTMISQMQTYSKIPLFVGVDEEGGRVSRVSKRFFTPIAPMGKIGATGDSRQAFEIGETIAGNIKSLGFNVDFAPVADVLTNPNNEAIGDRSFGSDVNVVSGMVEQEVIGLQSKGVSAAIKHFPGHGGTSADTHNGYVESKRTIEELRATEFLSFKAGIEAGTDFVMLSHITSVNAEDSGLPASLSKKIITEYLKDELGFEKIVITDALNMGAIASQYSAGEVAVISLQAGADMLLCPSDVGATVQGIENALENGDLTEERIDESVAKILQVKIDRKII
jgi:beta-N-acetylhexosaminidase